MSVWIVRASLGVCVSACIYVMAVGKGLAPLIAWVLFLVSTVTLVAILEELE